MTTIKQEMNPTMKDTQFIFYFGHNVGVSSGPNEFQACTAFTKNRGLHSVCSTRLLCKGFTTMEITTISPQSISNMYRAQTFSCRYRLIHGCCNIPNLYPVFGTFYSIRIVQNESGFFLRFD